MSFIPVLEYLAGITVFGFFYWIMDGVLDALKGSGVSATGDTYNLLFYMWVGILVVYLLFGGWWLIRKYDEQQYPGGYR